MKKRVELPLLEPLYGTYNREAPSTAILVTNPSIRNWYLNCVINLTCNRKFLNGFTTPEITVVNSSWVYNPYFNKNWMSTKYINGYINPIIRKLIDNGYYVIFDRVDDYYVKGKTWYKKRHFSHDGLICGYDQNDKTYCIYAYDSNWILQKFWTPQKCFNAGRIAMHKKGFFSNICGIQPKKDFVAFSPKTAISSIKEYLDSNLDKYPFDGEGAVYGIIVHKYISVYLDKLYNGDIPYDRMDYRVFRVIWEQKKVMLERLKMVEQSLNMDNEFSEKYKSIVSDANQMRILYASYHMKRKDSILPIIKNKLLKLMDEEELLLSLFVENAEKEIKNATMEIPEAKNEK